MTIRTPPRPTPRSRDAGSSLRRTFAPLALVVAAALPANGDPPAPAPSGPGASPASASAGPSWSYLVEATPALDRLHVSMEFPQGVPASLSLDDAAPAPWIVPAEGSLAPGEGGGFVPARGRGGAALAYDVDVARLVEKNGDSQRVGRDVVLRVGRWLLRPSPVAAGSSARLSFRLPTGVHASTPWPGIGVDGGPGPYRLDESAFRFWGHVALGRFDVDRSAAAGTTVDVAVLDAPHRVTRDGLRRWTAHALGAVGSLFGGRYPRPHLQVIVRPSAHGGARAVRDPVDLGATFPGGGAVLHAWIPASTEDDALENDWVAVHELVHLAMPAIRPEDSWLSEGVATYYQEVLRSRAWWDDEPRGWTSLAEGLAWGRSQPGGPSLRELAQDMHRTGTFYRTYWSGAAVASIADAEARKASEGRFSLDDAMRVWAREVGSPRLYGGEELLDMADAAAGTPLLRPVYERYLAARAFPDVGASWTWLGVVVARDGAVRLSDEAPGAAARRSIMAPHGPNAGLPASGGSAAPPAAPTGSPDARR